MKGITRYTGRSILISYRPTIHPFKALTAIGILLCDKGCAGIDIRPGKVEAIILLDEDDDMRERAAALSVILEAYADKGTVGWDIVDDPAQAVAP